MCRASAAEASAREIVLFYSLLYRIVLEDLIVGDKRKKCVLLYCVYNKLFCALELLHSLNIFYIAFFYESRAAIIIC